LSGLGL